MGAHDTLVTGQLHANAARSHVDLLDAGLGADGDAFVLQGLDDDGCKFGIVATERFLRLENGHLCPRRRCACASSSPIGPPPMMMR